jgi:DnaK suppressor protein
MAKKSKTVKKTRKITTSRKSAPVHRPTIKEIVRTARKPVMVESRRTPAAPLPAEQINKFRDVLSQKRDVLLEIVQRKKEEEIEDVGVGDEADIASHSVEKEMLFELTDSEKQTLDMVEAALRKMDKGVFGACESCLRAIPKMRLQLMPWARYCVDCQSEQEVPSAE